MMGLGVRRSEDKSDVTSTFVSKSAPFPLLVSLLNLPLQNAREIKKGEKKGVVVLMSLLYFPNPNPLPTGLLLTSHLIIASRSR